MDPKIIEARQAAQTALGILESAARALEAAGADTSAATLNQLQREFDAAHRAHQAAISKVEHLQALAEARAGMPVAPVLNTDGPTVRIGSEPLTYEDPHKIYSERSYLLDLVRSEVNGDQGARERLTRHAQEMVVEKRVNPNSTDGQGGEFVPPVWMQDQWVSLAKAGRITADACRSMPLPPGTDTINFPTVATGATTATQADAGNVSNTDVTTGSYSVGVKTIAGGQDVSLQLMDRSIPGFDVVTYEELNGRYAINLDTQILNGGGTGANAQGITGLSGTNSVTYTAATPTVAGLYSKMADAVQRVHTGRFLPPTAIIMHPTRWAWILASVDSNSRPLVVPDGDAFNQAAVLSSVAPEGIVGGMHGLPVLVDPNIINTNGAGTNEDVIYVVRLQDLWLMEDSPVKTRVLKEVLSGTLQVRIQLYNYFAFAAGRYPKSISKITGTGLVAPTF